MKSEYLENFSPIREYYESGNLKSETYLIHLIYVIYRYNESGVIIGLTINGVEYPPNSKLVFDEKEQKLIIEC